MAETVTSNTHTVVDELTPAEGRYLCGILYQAIVDGTPVSNRELREYLDVSGASVTGMIESLAAEGLLDYERYRGVELTDLGDRVARAILWRRCAMQRYFADELAVTLEDDRAYRMAFELEAGQIRAVGDRVEQPCEYHCEAEEATDCDVLGTG